MFSCCPDIAMRLWSKRKKFNNQDFYSLKKKSLHSGELFIDPSFPAVDTSISFSGNVPAGVVWKRPHDILATARFVSDGAATDDVCQGRLGNCWFVSACSVLASVKCLWEKVIPDHNNQEFFGDASSNYAGIFMFRFWRFGSWVEVVVDDLLPTVMGQLIYVRSRERGEFWSALLEKAYAKINGSYEALDGGNLCDALVDFTSGVSRLITIADAGLCDGGSGSDHQQQQLRCELFQQLKHQFEEDALLCASVAATSKEELEAQMENGLLKGHAYGVTAIKNVPIGNSSLLNFYKGREKIKMIRLRNPWGQKEWTGAFSDGSAEWSKISESERNNLGLTFDDDGEFWMTWDDFVDNFTHVSLCQLFNTALLSLSKTWNEDRRFGSWCVPVPGRSVDRAGGCLNHRKTFLFNPQYRFTVLRELDEVVVQLSQEDRRYLRRQRVDNLSIGFHIMKVEDNRRYRLHRIQESAANVEYQSSRSVYWRDRLPRGRYVLVPTTFEPGLEGKFMLRMFMDGDPHLTELVKDQPSPSACFTFRGTPVAVVSVKVECVSALSSPNSSSLDTYVQVVCGGETVTSHVVKQSLSPVFYLKAIFYRCADEHITVDVWERRVLRDRHLGRARVPDTLSGAQRVIEYQLPLYSKQLRANTVADRLPGQLQLSVTSCAELASL